MKKPSGAGLDWLAEVVLNVLREKSDLPPSWFEIKQDELAGRDRFNVLLWFNNLDAHKLSLIADHFKIDVIALQSAIRVVRCF